MDRRGFLKGLGAAAIAAAVPVAAKEYATGGTFKPTGSMSIWFDEASSVDWAKLEARTLSWYQKDYLNEWQQHVITSFDAAGLQAGDRIVVSSARRMGKTAATDGLYTVTSIKDGNLNVEKLDKKEVYRFLYGGDRDGGFRRKYSGGINIEGTQTGRLSAKRPSYTEIPRRVLHHDRRARQEHGRRLRGGHGYIEGTSCYARRISRC